MTAQPPRPMHHDPVGNTPLVALAHQHAAELREDGAGTVHAKWEGANPTGSMKDRMALGLIEDAEGRGALRPGMRVVEATGGSTGSSLAMVCARKGYPVHFVTSDAVSLEKRRTMTALGATLEVMSSEGRGITPELVQRALARVSDLAEEPDTYWTNQFDNPANSAGYTALGQELLAAGDVAAFVMGVGTGGCISGVASVLKEHPSRPLIVAVEPETSRGLSGGPVGGHALEGIGLGFVPKTARMDLVDEIEAVSDEEAFATAREIARRDGLLAGPSSGANVAVARRVARRLGPGRRVCTLLCDTGLRYLTGDLFAHEAATPDGVTGA